MWVQSKWEAMESGDMSGFRDVELRRLSWQRVAGVGEDLE